MDTILYKTLLYDFYIELLTDKQKDIFEMYYLEDCSLQEIGERFSISRQGARNIVKQAEKKLEYYESNLKLIHKHFLRQKLLSDVKLNILGLVRESKLYDIEDNIIKEFDKLK